MSELRSVVGTCQSCGSKIKGKSHSDEKEVRCPTCNAAVVLRPIETIPVARSVRTDLPTTARAERSRHEIDDSENGNDVDRSNGGYGPIPLLLMGVALGLCVGVPVGWFFGGRSKPAVADTARSSAVEPAAPAAPNVPALTAVEGEKPLEVAPGNPFKSRNEATTAEPTPDTESKPANDQPNRIYTDRGRGLARYTPKLDAVPEKDEEPILILFQTDRGGPDLDAAIAAAHYVGDITFTNSPATKGSISTGTVFRNRVRQGTVTVHYIGKEGESVDGKQLQFPLDSGGKVEVAIGAKRTVGGSYVFTRFLSPIATLGSDKPRSSPAAASPVTVTPAKSPLELAREESLAARASIADVLVGITDSATAEKAKKKLNEAGVRSRAALNKLKELQKPGAERANDPEDKSYRDRMSEVTKRLAEESKRLSQRLGAVSALELMRIWSVGDAGSAATAGPAPGEPKSPPPSKKPTVPLKRDELLGKWLLSDGVIEFQADGTFLNLGDKHKWALEDGAIVFTFNGKKSRATGAIADGRLAYEYDTDRGAIHALRLDPKAMAPGNGWTAADLAGDWANGDEITFKIESDGKKGFCNSRMARAGTNLANFEYANITFAIVDEIRLAKIQGAYWVVRLGADKKSLDLVAGDGSAFKPNTIQLKRK